MPRPVTVTAAAMAISAPRRNLTGLSSRSAAPTLSTGPFGFGRWLECRVPRGLVKLAKFERTDDLGDAPGECDGADPADQHGHG
jgi:hypothetical protein